jgi:hypothetical protein
VTVMGVSPSHFVPKALNSILVGTCGAAQAGVRFGVIFVSG